MPVIHCKASWYSRYSPVLVSFIVYPSSKILHVFTDAFFFECYMLEIGLNISD